MWNYFAKIIIFFSNKYKYTFKKYIVKILERILINFNTFIYILIIKYIIIPILILIYMIYKIYICSLEFNIYIDNLGYKIKSLLNNFCPNDKHCNLCINGTSNLNIKCCLFWSDLIRAFCIT